jgi:cytoskeletal protein RodZ
MAEIPIRKKSKSPVWLWILGILALVAIVVWFLTKNDTTSTTQQNQSSQVLKLQANRQIALKPKSMTQVPGIVSLKLETYLA